MHSKTKAHKILIVILRLSSYAVDQRLCMSTERHRSLGFTHLTVSILNRSIVSACTSDLFFSPVLLKYDRKQIFKKQYVILFLLQSEMLKLFIALFRANISMLLDH